MIKTWQERVASIPYLSIGMPLTAHDKEAAMQAEIDELRAENTRLLDALEACLSSLQYAWGCIENSTEQEDAKIEIGLDAARAALGES